MEAVEGHARGLLQALEVLDDQDRIALAVHMPLRRGRLWPKMIKHPWSELAESVGFIQRIDDESVFLAGLVEAAPAAWTPWIVTEKGEKLGPEVITAYLVVKDAASIFEWLTGMDATRRVDSLTGRETGPFRDFLGAIWPVVFGKGDDGLSSALKNWAPYREKERSALVANIAMRHPAWRLFED